MRIEKKTGEKNANIIFCKFSNVTARSKTEWNVFVACFWYFEVTCVVTPQSILFRISRERVEWSREKWCYFWLATIQINFTLKLALNFFVEQINVCMCEREWMNV